MALPSGSDIKIGISATNNASPVIKQVAADVAGLETSAKDATGGIQGANVEMDDMASIAKGLGPALAIVTTGITAMVAAFEFGEIAAGNDRLRVSGQSLADSYGESMDRIIEKVSEASLGTVSQMSIIESSNKAMMLGVGGSAEQLASLMEIAAFRGRAMGISTTQAFDDMVRGIGRMSPMILDNLGIVVDAEGTYGAYAESIGKSSSELTRAEKIQALLNKVLQEGNSMLKEAGGLAEDNAAHYERWNAELENTKNFLIEDTIEMSRFADMGADLLVSFRNLADNGIGYGGEKLNAFSLFMELGASRVANMREEQWAALDAAEAHGEALMGVVTSVEALAEAQQAEIVISKEAVQGAIKVQEAYDRYGEKLADLQVDHEELTAKKQELLNQGYLPEHDAILKLNDKLAENEQKQKDVTEAMKGTLEQMLLNTAAAGLNAEGQLALARATGQIDEATFEALSAQQLLKKEYEDGRLNADQYAKKTLELRDAVARLESKGIKVTVDAIFNEIRNIITNSYQNEVGAYYSNLNKPPGYSKGTQGWQTVPSGYPNDSYPIMLESGERFAVIPAGVQANDAGGGAGFGGGGNVYISYSPAMSFGNESDAMNNLQTIFLRLLEQAKADGQVS